MFSKSLALLALSAPTLATVFVTSPVASTTFHGGQPASVNWQDSSAPPNLQQFGNARVSIYVGNAQQQTFLQSIVDSVNVATTSSIQFTPDPSIGPNGNEYFIRFESLQARDPTNAQFPALAFSAKFTLDNMRGTFNATVQAQIAGQSTAPLAGQPTTGAAPSSSAAAATSGLSTATRAPTSTAARASASATASGSSSGALSVNAGWVGIVLSALVGVAAF